MTNKKQLLKEAQKALKPNDVSDVIQKLTKPEITKLLKEAYSEKDYIEYVEAVETLNCILRTKITYAFESDFDND